MSFAQAKKSRFISVPPPKTAHNIWVKSQALGLGTYKYLLRFNAPVGDCIQYAESIISHNELMQGGWTKTEFSNYDSVSMNTLVDDYFWWDINKIDIGFTWKYHPGDILGAPTIYESIFVDTEKGILYYYSGD